VTEPDSHGSQHVVVAAFLVNVAIALGKFVAAALSRSTAMLAEALHSLADCANQIFLFVGMRQSARPADDKHPFGHGPETYFWAFMAALCIFAVGGTLSIVEGIDKIQHPPEHLGDVRWAYGVLAMSVVLETYSFTVAMKEFRTIQKGRGIRRTLKEARDPTVMTVLFEDLAALFGLFVAGLGLFLAQRTGNARWDGAASIVVGLALVAVALMLGNDTKSLLIGESVTEEEQRRIEEIARAARDVMAVVHIRTIHLGPHEVMVGLKLTFSPSLDTRTLEVRINELEAQLRAAMPHLRRIYVEPGFDERALRGEG
jgi:cation diffusion facilitator family transporter